MVSIKRIHRILSRLMLLMIMCLYSLLNAVAQEFTPLWPEHKKPNTNGKAVTDDTYNERIWSVNTPGFYSFPVAGSENTGTSVLICPGGGYERISHVYNGFNMARWYNTLGINVYVLVYRLPHQQDLLQRELAPLQDAQRAMKIIRFHAAQWHIKPDKIGIMGISAGGHVAAMTGTHVKDESAIGDSLDHVSCRPDFMILLSPVITMGKYAHAGSKRNFLGPDTTKAMIDRYSNEMQVTPETPPTFMVHALNDSSVKVQNSLLFYNALIKNKVNSSIHIFPQGGHGIRLVENPGSTDLWTGLLHRWLKEMLFLTPIPFR